MQADKVLYAYEILFEKYESYYGVDNVKKAVIINDLSGLGKCSLTAAIPVISVMGVQAIPMATAVLSNQTDYESYYCTDLTPHMNAFAAEWKKRNLHPDGIYTGFIMNASQADIILSFIEEFSDQDTFLLTDPVMGDQGGVYDIYTPELLDKMRMLAHRAQIITPNLTEALLLLYGREEMLRVWSASQHETVYEDLGRKLIQKFHLQGVVITGLDIYEKDPSGNIIEYIGTLIGERKSEQTENTKESDNTALMDGMESENIRNNETIFWQIEKSPKIGGSYSGTGDIFASVICAGTLQGISLTESVKAAMNLIEKSLKDTIKEQTDRNDGICFEQHLWELRETLKNYEMF